MQSIIEFPVTLILSYFVASKFVEVCYIHFLFHENVTHLLPGVSLFILPSPLHIFSIRSDSSLDSAYFSFCVRTELNSSCTYKLFIMLFFLQFPML